MNFINNSEMAALIEAGMAETEVVKLLANGVTTTTIYAGAPFREAKQNGENWTSEEVWKIRRTVVIENGNTTTVSNRWAKGAWEDRAALTYQYL